MPKLTVNGKEVEFEPGMTVLQACEVAGEEIPRFCYHERLKIAGNCRMCLVQVEPGPPKPAASCAMPAAPDMKVQTNSPMVKKAREGVMEFLLINHPLDCPICDQGGECDLQDQSMTYGLGTNRFEENKRGVKDKNVGPLVKTHMTRCIHCTRCIRFLDDVAGSSEMGATGRGEHMEVGTFIEKNISSELSGNIIDLCPVGALTSKPYAFKARSWELKHTESVDVLDAVGSNIRVDSRGNEVMRVLPRLNEDVNEEWISDKTRFACDGLKNQRLDRPMIKKRGKFEEASWSDAFKLIAKKIKNTDADKIAAIAGDLADAESMIVLKELMDALGSKNIDCRQDEAKLDNSERSSYLFNTTISGIDQADACLIIGSDIRYEAPLVNTRLRNRYMRGGFEVASIGAETNSTYDINNLGQGVEIIKEMSSGKHAFSKVLKKAKNPMIIVGPGAYTRKDGAEILNLVSELCEAFGVVSKDWNGFNILHTAASRVAGMEIGFLPGKKGKDVDDILAAVRHELLDVVYLLGADEIDMHDLKNAFVIYQGHHGDAGANHADVILPGAAYTEKNATYINLEGRVQRTNLAVFPPGEAREDWKIIKDLADQLGVDLPYESLRQVRDRLVQVSDVFAKVNEVVPAKASTKFGKKGKTAKAAIQNKMGNFYMTDPISRASETMARCTAEFIEKNNKEAA